MNIKRFILLILAIILTAVLVIGGVMFVRVKQAMADPVSVFFGDEIVIPEAQEVGEKVTVRKADLVYNEKSYAKRDNIVTIVFLGRDKTPAKERRSDGGNTDIMIVVAVDLVTGDTRAISIPRDSVAHIYHYYDTKDYIDREYFDKLNGAYGAGPAQLDDIQLRNSVTCIAEHLNIFGTFDIVVNNYVEIGLVGLKSLTDKVGGVEITLQNGIPGVGSAGQTVNLNGTQAMTFVRDRHNSGGDLGRVSNSQLFIKSLARKLQSMGPTEIIPTLTSTMISSNLMRTDLTIEEISAFAGLLSKIDVSSINMQTIPVIDANDIGGYKEYLKDYDYNYEAFYGADKWSKLDVQSRDWYDFGFFTDYEALEEIMLNVYYEEIVLN